MTAFGTHWRNAERFAMLWLYAFITAVIVIEVIRRFVFDYSSIWGEEAARFAFVYLVWIGAAVGVRNRSHIAFTILFDALPPRAAVLLSMLGHIAVMVFAVFALWWSIDPVLTSYRFGSVAEGLRVSRVWFLIAVPLGFILVFGRAVGVMIEDMHAFRDNRRPPSGEKLFD
ncbi:TRAP transporter small permease [Oceaniglobus ichthyenteri]|uniref:TRAP transporter small permease n=1 Tax=Oceaniglobus ichthyenteri TaxID=2136177 RepID=UPI001F0B87EF|nr:TRAP transporter small permease [Oceaniglobus ichthyenteri]